MPNPDAVRAIDNEIGETEIRRLNGFAYSKARQLGWRRGLDALPGGGQPPDIVTEAIEKTIHGGNDGGHTWNRDQHPHVFDHLIAAVANILTNRVRLEEHKKSDGWTNQAELEQVKAESRNPEGQTVQKEIKKRENGQIQKLRKAVEDNGDELMEEVLEGILDGELKRSQIAEILDVDPKEVTNARKRILRLGRKILVDN